MRVPGYLGDTVSDGSGHPFVDRHTRGVQVTVPGDTDHDDDASHLRRIHVEAPLVAASWPPGWICALMASSAFGTSGPFHPPSDVDSGAGGGGDEDLAGGCGGGVIEAATGSAERAASSRGAQAARARIGTRVKARIESQPTRLWRAAIARTDDARPELVKSAATPSSSRLPLVRCQDIVRQVNENPASVDGVGVRRVKSRVALPVSSVPGPGPPPPSSSNVPPMAIVYVADPTWKAIVG